VLRRIFGPKRDKVTREWRKLHNQELNDLYCSPNIVCVIKLRRIRWEGQVACMGRKEAVTGLWGKLRETDHLEDPGNRWEDNSKMDLQEVGCGDMDWFRIRTGGGHL